LTSISNACIYTECTCGKLRSMQLQEWSWHCHEELDNLPSTSHKSDVLRVHRNSCGAVMRYRPAWKFTNIVANLADISCVSSRRRAHHTNVQLLPCTSISCADYVKRRNVTRKLLIKRKIKLM